MTQDLNPKMNSQTTLRSRWQERLGALREAFRNRRRCGLFCGALALLALAIGLGIFCSSPTPPPVVTPTIAPLAPIRERIATGVIRSGETISILLAPYLTSKEIYGLSCNTVTAGHPYRLTLLDDKFQRFEHDINDDYQLVIERSPSGAVTSTRQAIAYTYEEHSVGGTISDSLFVAVAETGENEALAIVLADIFACDIDFIRDVRQGDSFRVVFEKRLRNGQPAGYGKVLAAEFTNDGKTYKSFRFQDGTKKPGFYDLAGKSLRKAMLRAPLPFSRVSSGFTMRRFHPIAKSWRAHPAIDYAAPTGTPIMAVGDATIIAIGQTEGNGNYIKLRHSNGLETMYLHMSRFAKGMRGGKRVSQGEVIGYVGMTGLATGPHLCYRMTRYGEPVNPAKIPTTPGEPISRVNLEAFRTQIAPLLARLDNIPTVTSHAQTASVPPLPKLN